MKIIELQAENVKRLRAVEITPDGTMQVVGGKNAQGKSSVLDAIWLALGGGKASKETPLPIRDGEDRARVRLDLGDLIVTRTWTHKGTSLKVESADGAQYKSPQGMLDALVGQLSFDPLAFTRLSAKEQRDALLENFVLDDIDAIHSEYQRTFAERTEIGRQGKAIGDVEVDDTLPEEETSAAKILSDIQDVQTANDRRAAWEREEEAHRAACRQTDAEIKRLTKLLEEQNASFEEAQKQKSRYPEFRPIEPLREQLQRIEESNAAIRANNAAREKQAEKQRLWEEYQGRTERLIDLSSQKDLALSRAEFPIDGLSFDDTGVLYKGVPLSQASSAEQIRVSLAMGMALNPRLRVLMIKDGSLLDEDSMAAIREQVTEGGYQLWIEVVNPDDPSAVLIEDGMVIQP